MKVFQTGKWFLMIGLAFALAACGGGGEGGGEGGGGDAGGGTPSVNPTNSAALSAVLVIPNSTVKQGQLPVPSTSATRPTVTRSEESLAYSPGSQITLPVDYQASSGTLTTALVAVSGSNSYFQVPLSGAGTNGTVVLPVNLPAQVQNGNFCFDVMLVDSTGQAGDVQQICVTVVQPLACDTKRVSGGEGLTSTLHQMGGNAGTVRVQYETFTVKDKIDVFQNGVWVAGTGPVTDRATIRTALDCAVATEELGYVGQNSEFLFNYNPVLGGDVEVVVSGCENNGTAWNYTASCPGVFGASTGGTLTLSAPFAGLSSQAYVYDAVSSLNIWRVGTREAQVAAAQMQINDNPGFAGELLSFFVYEGYGFSGSWVDVGENYKKDCVLSGTDPYNTYPLCSSWGITVNRSAGTISFDSTPVLDSAGTTGTMSGSLTFTPSGPDTGNPTTTYSISGTVKDSSNAGISAVAIALSGSATQTTNTDSSGNYTFTGLTNGTYTLTPSKTGYTFNPASQSVTVSNANVTGKNFAISSSSGGTYSISGKASNSTNVSISGVTMTLSGSNSASTSTDSNGNYSFTGLANGSYTVTPSKTGYTFNPSNKAVILSGANLTGQDFVGSASTTAGGITDFNAIWKNASGTVKILGVGSQINFYSIAYSSSNSSWYDALQKGFIAIGDPWIRNIVPSGTNSWTAEVLWKAGTTSAGVTSVDWSANSTLSLSNGGTTLTIISTSPYSGADSSAVMYKE